MDIVLATTNPGKVREFIAMMANVEGVNVRTLDEFDNVPEVIEDGDTFEANAEKKATVVAKATGVWALSDDSGLAVDALGGAPGIHSARYAGERATDEQNLDKVLADLANVPERKRRAQFVCALVLSDPQGRVVHVVQDECAGSILFERRGDGGFGYDPVFLLESSTQTTGELTREEKAAISHRGKAMRSMVVYIEAHVKRPA